ncbi:hypothetical protein NKG05_25565 [Oerskovia sp. M15]
MTAHPTLADVVRTLEALYPPSTAEGWDAVGLVTGTQTSRSAGSSSRWTRSRPSPPRRSSGEPTWS